MGTPNAGGMLDFEDAVLKTFEMATTEVMKNPVRFLSFVTDLSDHSQMAYVVFSHNCDEEMLAPFLETLPTCNESQLKVTATKCVYTLTQGRGISDEAAQACADGIAGALAKAMGIHYEPLQSVKKTEPQRPEPSAQTATRPTPQSSGPTQQASQPRSQSQTSSQQYTARSQQYAQTQYSQTPPYAQTTHTIPQAQPQPQAYATPVQQPQKSNTGLVVGIVAVLCVAMVAGVLYILLGNGSSSEGTTQVAEETTTQEGTGEAQEPGKVTTGEILQPDDSVTVKTGLDEYSWDELGRIGQEIAACGSRQEALSLAEQYNLVGPGGKMFSATKSVQTTDGQTIDVRLVDVYHDEADTSSGYAGLTFIATNSAHRHSMSTGKYTVGGWESSEMRSWISSSLLDTFPQDLRNVMVPVYKWSNNEGESRSSSCVTATIDTLWIPSIVELAGNVAWNYHTDPSNSGYYNSVFNSEGYQYAAYEQAGIIDDNNNAALSIPGGNWWLRSTAASTGRGRYVTAGGDPSGFGDSFENWQVVVGFCL